MPHRCILGCKDTDAVMHSFPDPEHHLERFKRWVDIAGGKLETSEDYKYYKKRKICDIHFTTEHRNRFKRLNALAVPSLYLPGVADSQQTQRDYQPPKEPASTSERNDGPTEDVLLTCSLSEAAVPITSGESHGRGPPAAVLLEHNYSVISRGRQNIKGIARTPVFHTQVGPLRTKIRYLRSEISRLTKKGQTFKERLAKAEKMSNNVAFNQVIENMTKPAQLFVHMQLQSKKKRKGRRFTIKEKVLALSLYKKSPKCYRLLYSYFALPSSKAMKRLISQIKLTPGINNIIFEKLKKTLQEKDASDRLCSLIFDEMSITPQVSYNLQKDEIQGFTANHEARFADHVLVFMVKGIKRNFKQPIAYYFTNGLNKLELKDMIKNVIKYALKARLIIVNTVCDQSTVNVGAITELVNETKAIYLRQGKDWRNDVFSIMGKDIIPIYDTPHLIKGIRNNLLTKDLSYTTETGEKIMKWEYFQMVYAADKSYGELRLLDKITEEHINPDKIHKMRVKSATQLFSHSVAVATEHLTARGDLPEDCRNLIEFTILIDNLFDSLNVSSLSIPNGKIYKGPIKQNSPHHELWRKARVVLKTVKFLKKVKVGDKIRLTETIVPSISNLIKTVEGIEALWKVLSSKYRLDVMLTRNLNQDPLENFFGNIRSYGARNIAPNTVAFEGAFKALLLNNFNAPHSSRANCEVDSNKCLQTLEFFLEEKNTRAREVSEEKEIRFSAECLDQPNENDAGQSNYVCGWVIRKCLKNIVKNCQHCRLDLLHNASSNKKNDFLRAKEFHNKQWLCYPSEKMAKLFAEIQNIVVSYLKGKFQKKYLKKTIIQMIEIIVNFSFNCPKHNASLKMFFQNTTINVLIFSWCRSVNRILSGKLTYVGDDCSKIAAQNYYNKHKNYKNRK